MSQGSNIEWTDATWNPVRGCTKVSPGCANCYAETFAERWRGVKGHAYEQGFDLRLVPEKLDEPNGWKKPKRIFVNSMSDLFQDGVPDSFIDRVVGTMAWARQHTYQLLTKRPERMRAYWMGLLALDPQARTRRILASQYADHPARLLVLENIDDAHLGGFDWPLPNVWLGVSVENQHFADERIPLLLQTPAAVRFISAEPLLGPVDLRYVPWPQERPKFPETDDISDGRNALRLIAGTRLDWVIVGSESGHGARPMDEAWVRLLRDQCVSSGVPFFYKQKTVNGRKFSLPMLDGVTWNQFPTVRA